VLLDDVEPRGRVDDGLYVAISWPGTTKNCRAPDERRRREGEADRPEQDDREALGMAPDDDRRAAP
jgi:hypothetical protein